MDSAVRPPGRHGIGGVGRVAEKRHRPDRRPLPAPRLPRVRGAGRGNAGVQDAAARPRQFSAAVQPIASALASTPTTPTQEPRSIDLTHRKAGLPGGRTASRCSAL